ncbi:DNA-directed RNA polymerase specialized sigma subunit [Clostridium beijerinckii]|uniref:sigma factor-like helix-turn-helix DNA-binding protein n=1 Tax=Clostridium beijerinckii TaxID=1520 RepID=UPI001F4C125F|nr:sigma factor-like helix-turn-helix DNA-binding protein [Clostridium beijerinckii]NRT34533.1 DNA-directed RNA polymerase specialized sigma subunit [Clostridium beijerinckii]NRT46037.1 DNA-directed RNA polymerase specialized sigma subunit [Clostridium beijerinckii]NRZ19961.1 DNA-directed RNA polymerase specialized sigma subunit [Clostridium beijerinckii]
MINIAVDEIRKRIDNNLKSLKELDEKYLKAYRPKGWPEGTSYNDYDSIHGGKKEPRIEDYYKERQKILALIELDEQLIVSVGLQVDDGYVNLLENNQQKVKYYRFIKGYTQTRTAELLNLSERHVQRIEKEIKMSSLLSCSLDFR